MADVNIDTQFCNPPKRTACSRQHTAFPPYLVVMESTYKSRGNFVCLARFDWTQILVSTGVFRVIDKEGFFIGSFKPDDALDTKKYVSY